MENFSSLGREDDQIELPAGFRFHPTDEELITHYLSPKVVNSSFTARAIGEADMNKVEPWDLPWRAKMGEKEWYFFCVRDKKYPTGLRTNRATAAGYWKATGKDREIVRGKALVGMKKTLVFYRGRAPKGEKTNWVIHEYRLEGKFSLQNLPKSAKNDWVICRVFEKSSGGKKVHISGLVRLNSLGNDLVPSALPPLTESPNIGSRNRETVPESVHVSCFSNPIDIQKSQEEIINHFSYDSLFPAKSNPANNLSSIPLPNQLQGNFTLPGSSFAIQDQETLRSFLENYGPNMKQGLKTEKEIASVSQETGLNTELNTEISSVVSNLNMGRRSFEHQEAMAPSASTGPLDLDCFWSY